jgi:hypothetical protein
VKREKESEKREKDIYWGEGGGRKSERLIVSVRREQRESAERSETRETKEIQRELRER